MHRPRRDEREVAVAGMDIAKTSNVLCKRRDAPETFELDEHVWPSVVTRLPYDQIDAATRRTWNIGFLQTWDEHTGNFSNGHLGSDAQATLLVDGNRDLIANEALGRPPLCAVRGDSLIEFARGLHLRDDLARECPWVVHPRDHRRTS